jgi:cysteinyl-tRNA synthetase
MYDTRSRQLLHITESVVELYLCGHTAYKPPHLGNLRPVVVFDLLIRVLHRLGQQVVYTRNTTDIDDKIIARAAEHEITISEIVETATSAHKHAEEGLGCAPPTFNPYATAYIPQMLELISSLIARELAYEADGHVLFKVKDELIDFYPSQCQIDENEVVAYKRNQRDFVLWKPSKPGEPAWPSPYGLGRPGWHTECVAMIMGTSKHLTIHGGGCDLRFPHHANELLQLKEFGRTPRLWIHTGMITAGDGQKMSKSVGNTVDVCELLEYIPGAILRLALLSTHYSQPLPWTADKLEQAAKLWNRLLHRLESARYSPTEDKREPEDRQVLVALCNNLNTPQALTELEQLSGRQLFDSMELLGLFDANFLPGRASYTMVEECVEKFKAAYQAGNYIESDRIREALADEGVVLGMNGKWRCGLPSDWRQRAFPTRSNTDLNST